MDPVTSQADAPRRAAGFDPAGSGARRMMVTRVGVIATVAGLSIDGRAEMVVSRDATRCARIEPVVSFAPVWPETRHSFDGLPSPQVSRCELHATASSSGTATMTASLTGPLRRRPFMDMLITP